LKAKQEQDITAGNKAAKMNKPNQAVFFLWHFQKSANQEEAKLIGVYPTEQRALSAQNRVKLLPSFKDHPNGFLIDRCEVGREVSSMQR
jgi:hypothetical protein